MSGLPPFPVDDATLSAVEHALDGAWSVDGEGTHTLVGADFTLDRVLSFAAGIDRSEDAEHLTQIASDVFVDDRIHYHPNDVIRALIVEVRRLRTTQGEPMQTYIFTVAVSGENVQDAADELRDHIIEGLPADKGVDFHVTESIRVIG